jgi:hypothetical protein
LINSTKGAKNKNLKENTALGVGSLMRKVTWLTKIYKKKVEFT